MFDFEIAENKKELDVLTNKLENEKIKFAKYLLKDFNPNTLKEEPQKLKINKKILRENKIKKFFKMLFSLS